MRMGKYYIEIFSFYYSFTDSATDTVADEMLLVVTRLSGGINASESRFNGLVH
jgi:hypothetical protein